ncbi:MAG: TIGR03757 family integrating conjugative element protein [Burkholderiales bacterium]|nr:MAG: TIGR03757 family integrating conjugative element protein [Burkholderiales bacterium]
MKLNARIMGLALCAVTVGAIGQITSTVTTSSQIRSTQVGQMASVRIEVFTNSSIYLTNTAGATVYLLDGLEQLEEELSQGLPTNEAAAEPVARERLRKMGAAELQRRAANASEGIARAGQYGIDRVPAIVFNGQSIVYGVTDIAQAKSAYLNAVLRAQPSK